MQWIGVCCYLCPTGCVLDSFLSVYVYFEFCCTAISPSPSFQRSCARATRGLCQASNKSVARTKICRPIWESRTRKLHVLLASPPSHPTGIAAIQLFAFNNTTGARLDSDLIKHLKKLSIGVNLPCKRSCRGGRRKQRKIEVVCGVGPPSDSLAFPSTESGHVLPSILCNLTPMPPRPHGSNLTNLITVPLQDSATLPNQLCLCVFNAWSVGTSSKRSAICDFVRDIAKVSNL